MEVIGALILFAIAIGATIDSKNLFRKPVDPPTKPKIDITNNRVTTPQTESFQAAYNKRRKSMWNTPKQKADIINYEKYILSEEWLDSSARLSKLVTTGGKCETCNSTNGTHVHHISYTNLGKESTEDLAVLCPACHDYTHRMAGKGAGYYPPLQCPTTK